MKLFVTGLLCLTLSTLTIADADTMSKGIFELINQRLTYMQDVALFKATNHRAIEDLTREKQVLEKALFDAQQAGLQPDSIAVFFQAQIDAAKAIQYRYRAEWLSAKPENKKHRDLASEVRPKLIELGHQIVMQISEYLQNGGAFDNNMQQDFVRTVNAAHLSENDKKKMFESLQMIRVIKNQ
ncbi:MULTISPECIES: chorismate mutase [unclassified Endozoicomonas]|uniref:chorismate mutase n=1 Tax=unclassified Endozoicomonas TaxID=2644528 RepID=UPI0021475AA7|nr:MULTISPECIES: chorismate mutase [unclassified Endozoicomonas]